MLNFEGVNGFFCIHLSLSGIMSTIYPCWSNKKNTISWWFCATRLKPYDRQFGAHPSQEIDWNRQKSLKPPSICNDSFIFWGNIQHHSKETQRLTQWKHPVEKTPNKKHPLSSPNLWSRASCRKCRSLGFGTKVSWNRLMEISGGTCELGLIQRIPWQLFLLVQIITSLRVNSPSLRVWGRHPDRKVLVKIASKDYTAWN